MKLLLVFIVTLCAAAMAAPLTDTEITDKWVQYKKDFNKNYADENEDNRRRQLFADNLKLIEEHNKKYQAGEVTYELGINQFSDQTAEERRPYTHGVLKPKTATN